MVLLRFTSRIWHGEVAMGWDEMGEVGLLSSNNRVFFCLVFLAKYEVQFYGLNTLEVYCSPYME